MKKEYLINEIAKMFNITKRTLQYYDKIDLLKPAFIKENGYRVYGDEELAKLIEILIWKNIGLDSCDIKKVFKEKTFENIEKVINEVDIKLECELQRIQFLKENVNLVKERFKNKNSSYNEIIIKRLDERKILKIKESGESLNNLSDMLSTGTKILKETINNQIPFVEFGFIFDKDRSIAKDYTRFSSYFFTICKNHEIDNSINLSKGSYACSWFKGDLRDLDEEIKKSLSWIEENGYTLAGDIIYSESFSSLYYEDPFKTDGEIQIPINLHDLCP